VASQGSFRRRDEEEKVKALIIRIRSKILTRLIGNIRRATFLEEATCISNMHTYRYLWFQPACPSVVLVTDTNQKRLKFATF
jgi:hypothetical protein